jgi:PAS domain S-box-containing protein
MQEGPCLSAHLAAERQYAFIPSGSRTGQLIASLAPAATPLGDVDHWPQSLTIAVGMMLPAEAQIVLFWGPDYVALYNDAYAPSIGDKHPRALGRPARENWAELWDDLEPLLRGVRNSGDTFSAKDRPFYLERHDGAGETVYFDVSYSAVPDLDGSVGGVLCIVAETTERVRAVQALRESEERFRNMADHAPVMTWVTDPSGACTYLNRRWYEFTGQTREDAEGFGWLDAVHPDDRGWSGQTFMAANERHESFQLEYRLRRSDGTYRWAIDAASPRFDVQGNFLGFIGSVFDIEDRREIENRLRASEEFSRRVLQSSADCIKVLDLDGNLEFLSEGGMTTMEVDDFASIKGACWSDFWSGDESVKVQAAIDQARTGGTGRFQGFATTMKGTPRWWDVMVTPIIGADGTPERLLSVSRDVTATRNAEELLRASESKFEAITNSIDQMIWSTRPDGYHDYYNDRWYEFTGVPYGSTDGAAWNGMFHPDDQDAAWAVWRRSLATGEPYHIEYRLRHHSGEYRWVIGRAQCVRDGTGQITRWFGTCTDVNDLKVAEASLRELNETLESRVAEALAERKLWAEVFESSDALIGALSPERRYLAVNKAYADEFERIYGVRPRPGDSLPELLAHLPGQQVAATTIWNRALDGEEFTVIQEFGEGHVARPCYELRFNTLRDADGTIIGAFQYAVDVTERLRKETELTQMRETLRQSQKMETLGQLTGGVAHDFNNLLQIVQGNLDILQRNLASDSPRLRRAVDNALTGAKRAATLTQRLLAFSRRQPLAPKVIDVNKLVGGMSELLHRTLGETIELETVLAAGLWRVEADPNQLENALLNLAVNARDAMQEGGKLTIETHNTHLDRAYSAQNAEVVPGQYVVICVSDTGTGMDEATASRVFEPFFTTKEVGKGTGLGLSMVYGFVKQSGGHVKIYSEIDHGTTLRIYLPRLLGASEEELEAAAPLVPEGTREETILVCEDDDDVRAYSVEVLRELGYRVLEAYDGASALRLLNRQDGRVDLLFSDVVLPGGMTGADLAVEARALRPNLKVLFTTGYARDAIVHHGRLDAGVELITKPFSYEELAARVRDVLDAKPRQDPPPSPT